MKNLKRLFRGTSPGILRNYFEARGAGFADELDGLSDERKRANVIEHRLAGLPDRLEDDIRAELEVIEEIATGDGWIAMDEVCKGAGIDVPEAEGAEGAAFFVALNHPELLPRIVNTASMNRYNGGRQWGCFLLDGATFCADAVLCESARESFVGAALAARTFPASRPHEKDWFSVARRDPVSGGKTEILYLTLYVLDRPVKEMTVDDDNRFLMALRKRVEEMIFAFNPDAGEIEIYSKGGARMHRRLAEAFGESFFDTSAEPVLVEPRPVNFEPLKRKPDFDIRPSDRIEGVSVVKLGFWGDDLRSFYDHASDSSDIYDIIRHKLGNRSPLDCGDLIVSATLKIRRVKGEGKTLTIDLGYPSRTTLPNQSGEDRVLSLGLLERWGILEPELPVGSP